MKTWCKRLIATIVSVVMLLGMVPAASFAMPIDNNSAYEQQLAAQKAAAEAAAAEAARKAAEQAAAEQAKIDSQSQSGGASSQGGQSAWQKVDQAADPQAYSQYHNSTPASSGEEEAKEEEAFPAVTLEGISLGGEATLSVNAPAGALPAGVKVSARSLSGQEAVDARAAVAGAMSGSLLQGKAWAVRFYTEKDGSTQTVAPKSAVSISVNRVRISGKTAALYNVNGAAATLLAGPVDNSANSEQGFTATTSDVAVLVVAGEAELADASTTAPSENKNEDEAAAEDDEEADPEETALVPIEVTKSEILESAKQKITGVVALVAEMLSGENFEEQAAEEEPAEPTYPAAQLSGGAAGIDVSVYAPEGALPAGVQLSVSAVETPAAVLENANASAEDAITLDVFFYLPEDPGTEIEPKTAVNVTFANIGLDAEAVDVYHEADKIAEISPEGATLALDQFSPYTFVANSGTAQEADNTEYKIEIPDQNLKLVAGEATNTIDVASIVKMYKKNAETDAWDDYTFDSQYWDIAVSGTSCSLSGWTISATGLGSSKVTVSHQESSGYWTNKPLSVTFNVNVTTEVTYDGNGADEGLTYSVTYSKGEPTLQPQGSFAKTGKVFAGWSTDRNATTAEFQPGDEILANDLYGKTVYAVWVDTPVIKVNVSKDWDDVDDADGLRPISVPITFEYSTDNGTTWKTYGTRDLMGGAMEWKNSFTDVRLVQSSTGNPLTLRFKEDTVPTDYAASIAAGTKTAEGNTITLSANEVRALFGKESLDVTFKNTHKPATIDIPVTKVWNDSDNRDGKRPVSVDVTLMKGDEEVATQTITEAADGTWTGTFEDVQKNEGGQPITYTLEETAIDGYTTAITGNAENGFTVTNTHKLETVTIHVDKVWEDADDQDGIRPDILYIHVLADGVKQRQKTISEENNWSRDITAQQQYKYREGEVGVPIEYTVVESINRSGPAAMTDGYTTTFSSGEGADEKTDGSVVFDDTVGSVTITNTHTPVTRELAVFKSWEDENGDTSRRSDVTVNVLADEEPATDAEGNELTLTLNEGKGWTGTIEVDKYGFDPTTGKGGHEIEYTMEEEDVPAYRNEGTTGDMETGFELHNTYIPNTTTVTIKKVWKDANNVDGLRPYVAELMLMNNGEIVKQTNLRPAAGDTGNVWTKTFTDVPVYSDITDPNSIIDYYVEEANNYPYVATVEREGDGIDGYTFTVTNKLTDAGKIDIPVTKIWDDDDNRDGIRPESVEVTLRSGGGTVDSLTLTEADGWKGTFEDVPAFDLDTEEEIEYSLIESGVDEEVYTTEITGDAASGFTVTNTHKPEIIDSIAVTKVRSDADNQDGKRPETAYLRLYKADGTYAGKQKAVTANTDWATTFTSSQKTPIYKYENGEEIQYTVREFNGQGGSATEGAPEGYTYEVTGNATDGFTVTNTHKPETIEIDVTKVWDDADNQDGIRPETVYARLFKADGTYMNKQLALSETNGWSTTFTSSEKTPIYKYENGEEIEYVVVEAATRSGIPEAPEGYTVDVMGNATDGFTVINTHEPELREITVTKVWDDNNDQDGVRPDEIYAVVYADGERVRQRALNEANDWTTTITAEQQYKYKPGEVGVPIKYTVEESWEKGEDTEVDPNGNYELVGVEGDMDAGFTITNYHEPEMIDINISKVWADEKDNNRDGVRPESITYVILADGEEVERCVVTEEANWEYTATRPKYDNGQEIAYTVVEEVENDYVPSYEVSAVSATKEGENDQINVVVTNTYDPEKTTIAVVKQWDDNNDQDGLRPESVTVNLLADGEPALDENDEPITAELNAGNGWAHYFEGVWKNANNGTASEPDVTPIKYTVEETGYMYADDEEVFEGIPEGYEVSYSDFADSGAITITNTHEPETAIVMLEKVWKDGNNRDGIRPSEIKFNIEGTIWDSPFIVYSEDIVVRGTVADDPNEWIKAIVLPVYQKGEEVIYTVTEEAVPGYTVEGEEFQILDLIDPENLFYAECSFTNVHKPEVVEIPVTKVWNDNEDQDGVRPDEVYAQVYANGVYQRQRELNEANGWETTITAEKQYKYENGKEINYTIKEN